MKETGFTALSDSIGDLERRASDSADKALGTLEYFKILDMLADCAATEGARARALSLRPDHHPERIRKKLAQTSDAKKLASVKGKPPFGNVKDIGGALERAEKSAVISTRELLDIAEVLYVARRLLDYYNTDRRGELESTSLDEIFGRLQPDRTLENKITKAIVAEDMIADEASPELAEIRRKIKAAQNRIRESLQRYVQGETYSRYLQDNIITMRNGRYVIPVKAEYKNEIKGLIHDTSASGATLFIEPMAVVEANNELRELESREQHEIERILAELSADCAAVSDVISRDYHAITELAFIFAKAELSLRLDATAPALTEERCVELYRARHPLLDKNKVVPVTILLGKAGGRDYTTLVVTGPNTGGKTVTLKTVGLFALMAQSGLHIPADDSSRICVFDKVLADIGDEQSIEQSLSTFSAHMVNIAGIMKTVDDRSLVLFDELGAGTDPTEGAALAIAILEAIRRRGALCVATTHYAELKAYALETDGVANASCEFDVETLRPTYRLIIGSPGKSNAFAISLKLGLDPNIIEDAKKRISGDEKRFELLVEKLEESRIEMERQRDEAARLRREYEAFKAEQEEKIRRRLAEAERELEKAQAKAIQIVESAKLTSEFVLEELEELKRQRDSEMLGDRLDAARREIRRKLRNARNEATPVREVTDEEYVLPRPLKKGDEVLIVNIGKRGVLTSDPDESGNVTVKAGIISTKTNIKNLKLIEESVTVTDSERKQYTAKQYRDVVVKSVSPTLDLRGQTGDDGWHYTDKYLDDAKLAGVHSVTLIHGKGTGALRRALWDQLKKDPRVKSYRLGAYGEGDAGVTVVELN